MEKKKTRTVDGYSMGELSRLAGIKNTQKTHQSKKDKLYRKRKHKNNDRDY